MKNGNGLRHFDCVYFEWRATAYIKHDDVTIALDIWNVILACVLPTA